VAVVAMEKFLEVGRKLGLIRKVPESETPDVQAILRRIQTIGDILMAWNTFQAKFVFPIQLMEAVMNQKNGNNRPKVELGLNGRLFCGS